MGICTTLPAKQIPTILEELQITNNNIISFKISPNQPKSHLIEGIYIILIRPFCIIPYYISQPYSQREIFIDLTYLFAQHQKQIKPFIKFNSHQQSLDNKVNSLIPLANGTKIQFRLAFFYKNFKCQPTVVHTIAFNAGNKMQKGFRFPIQKINKHNKYLINKIRNFQHQSIKYYKFNQSHINIVLLGASGCGKSTYIQQISKLVCDQPLHPLIGSHKNLEVSVINKFEKYVISQSSCLKINLYDTVATKNIQAQNIISILRGRIGSTQQFYQNVVHSAIVFINCEDKGSFKTAQQQIKMLIKQKVPYTLVFTHLQKQLQSFHDYYLKEINKKIQSSLTLQTNLSLNESKTFPLSNLKSQEGNKYAQFALLQNFLETLNLAGAFYFNNPPLHVMLDDQLLDIKYKIKDNTSLSQFVSLIGLDFLLMENHKQQIKNIYIESYYGPRTSRKKGVIRIEKQMKKSQSYLLENYISIVDKKFKVINLYTKVPFFSKQLQ